VFAAGFWALPMGAGLYEWPCINGRLASKRIVLRKALVLPAQITFAKVSAKGSEGGISEGDQIARSFYDAVIAELAQRGVEVLPDPLTTAKDDAARYAVADLQARFDNVALQVRRKPIHVEKGEFTLGDRVAKFEPGAAADVLVFLRGTGQTLTPARMAIAVATGNGATQFRGDVTLVDAKTGEVLAFLRFNRSRDMTQKTGERFAQNMRRALHDVPLPMPPAR
jgi:hypothetical protein